MCALLLCGACLLQGWPPTAGVRARGTAATYGGPALTAGGRPGGSEARCSGAGTAAATASTWQRRFRQPAAPVFAVCVRLCVSQCHPSPRTTATQAHTPSLTPPPAPPIPPTHKPSRAALLTPHSLGAHHPQHAHAKGTHTPQQQRRLVIHANELDATADGITTGMSSPHLV